MSTAEKIGLAIPAIGCWIIIVAIGIDKLAELLRKKR